MIAYPRGSDGTGHDIPVRPARRPKTGLCLAAALAIFALPIQAQAQSDCPSIENDIARLACFDAQFPRTAVAETGPRALFDSLRRLAAATPDLSGNREDIVKFEGSYLDFVSFGTGCDMVVVHVVPALGRRGSDDFGVTRLLGYDYTVHEFDMRHVDSVRPVNMQGQLSVSMTKGNDIIRFSFRTDPTPGFDTDVSAQLMILNSQGALVPEVARTQVIQISAQPEDAAAAAELFSQLAEACKRG